jgi:hypothetical protein
MMSVKAKLFLSAVATMVAMGCGATSNRHPGADFTVGKFSSVVVMGVSPEVRFRAYQGWSDGKEWEQNKLAKATINTNPENGYVVVSMKPTLKGESYGILRVIPSVVNVLSVCTGGSTAVFEVPSSSVVYVGEFRLTNDDEYRVEVGYDFDKALSFMKKTYPSLADRLAKSRARVAKVTNGQCDGKPVSFIAK